MLATETAMSALERNWSMVDKALEDVDDAMLGDRLNEESNSMGWLLFHMNRIVDRFVHTWCQDTLQLWMKDGWNEKFGLPTRDNGFDHTLEQVSNFPAYDLKEMLAYGAKVRAETLSYLKTVTPGQMDAVPREARPEMSVGRIFRQVIGEVYQHQGHIAYLKGLLRAGR